MEILSHSHFSTLPNCSRASTSMATATAASPCLFLPSLSVVRCSGTRATPLITRSKRKSDNISARFDNSKVLSSKRAFILGIVSLYQASVIIISRTSSGQYSCRAASASAEPLPRASREMPEKWGSASRMAKRICSCVRYGQFRSSRMNGGTRRKSFVSVAGTKTERSPVRPKSSPA